MSETEKPKVAPWGVAAAAALAAILHLVCLTQYGFFRDELYYLACAARLDWGYVDHPPLSIVVLAAITRLLGQELWAVRLPGLFIGAGFIVLAGLMARRMGGGPFAQMMAALGMALPPVYLVITHLYSMNGLDVLLWSAAFLVLLRILEKNEPRDWVILGVVIGLGFLNKWSILWLVAGLVPAFLFTEHRSKLASPWPYLAAFVALCLAAPNLWWQAQHGWPTLEFARNANDLKMQPIAPWEFVLSQVVVMSPVLAPMWIAGLCSALGGQEGKRWRFFAIVFLTVVAILLINGRSRVNYLSPAYPPLVALGAVVAERWLAQRGNRVRAGVAAAAVLGSGPPVSLALPMLPISTLVWIAESSPVQPPKDEKGEKSPVRGHADMFGWPETVEAVAEVYHSLPEEDRARVRIFGRNYGEAAAVDALGPKLGLPPAIGGHNQYWLWGPRGWDGEVLIYINTVPDSIRPFFESIEEQAVVHAPYAVPEQQDAPITVLRGLKIPVEEFWPKVRKYM